MMRRLHWISPFVLAFSIGSAHAAAPTTAPAAATPPLRRHLSQLDVTDATLDDALQQLGRKAEAEQAIAESKRIRARELEREQKLRLGR